MAISVPKSRGSDAVPGADEVRQELDRVLNSPVFRGSKRCHDFLNYVVNRVLEGNSKSLKERTLATEVFERDVREDLSDVSVVRVGAREVRKRLAQYYVSEGAMNPLRIDLPSGSYIATFHYKDLSTQHEPAIVTQVIPAPTPALPFADPGQPFTRRPLKRSKQAWWFTAVTTGGLLALALWGMRHFATPFPQFQAFWNPAFHQKAPIGILMAHPIAYHPSSRANQLDRQLNGESTSPLQRAIQVPPNLLDGSDFVPARDQYVGFGDTVAAVRLTSLFVQNHQQSNVRLASRVEFNDLVDAGLVLIGAYTNRWTGELTKQGRFHFTWVNGKPTIQDSTTSKHWALNSKLDNGESNEDYVLVARLPHSQTNGFVVVCAGINYYGTEEGGRILAEPTLLEPILKKLPADWPNRNLEVLLHVEVIGGGPALPEVVASYTW